MQNLKGYGLLAALLVSGIALADPDQLVIDGGIGIWHSGEHSLSETKMFTLGVQEQLMGPWKDRLIGGGWIDNAGNGKTGSALVSGQIGFEVNRDGTLFGAFTGPCLISNPDQVLLGGYFEFMDDLHLGIQDRQGNYFGIMYRHISDAGLTRVNVGRDIIGLEMRF